MIKVSKIIQMNINTYEVSFDNHHIIKLYDEVIIKFNLVVGSSLEESLLEKIRKYNDVIVIFFKYRNFLLKRMYSKKKIYDKLNAENLSLESIEEIILKLEKLNLLNDDRYLEEYINYKINFSLDGPLKIKHHLINEAIDKIKIEIKLNEYDDFFWNKRINKIIVKKNKKNHKDSFKIYEIKLKKYIYSLGYVGNVYVEKEEEKELEILEKEYLKLNIKNVNEKEIKTKLLKKGFEINDIKKIECKF